jgi:RNA polymerase sigma-70 factor, ECF subfamily
VSSSAARYFPGLFGKTAPGVDCRQGEKDRGEPCAEAAKEACSISVPSSRLAESDELLVAKICEGDREALARLFRRHARGVRAISYRVLRDTSEADDLVQDLFLLVQRDCKTFDSSKSPPVLDLSDGLSPGCLPATLFDLSSFLYAPRPCRRCKRSGRSAIGVRRV